MPTFHVTSPDGATYEVNGPDGSTEQDAIAYVQKGMNVPAAAPQQQDSLQPPTQIEQAPPSQNFAPNTAPAPLDPQRRIAVQPPTKGPVNWGAIGNSMAAGAVDAATFNQGNKLDAYLQTLTGLGGVRGDYAGNLARTLAADASAKADSPGAYTVGSAAGAFANPVTKLLAKGANAILPATGPGVGAAVAKYANRIGQGALNGAGYGAGFAEPGQEKEGAITGAIGGGLVAGVVQTVADAAAPILNRNTVATMSQDQFKQAAQKAYKAVDDAGVTVDQGIFQNFVKDLPQDLNGFHPKVTPGANNIISALQDEAAQGPVTLSTLDKLRSIAGEASVTQDRNEARLAGSIAGKIDEFVDGLKASDLVGGAQNAQATKDTLTSARDLWKTYSKIKTVSDIVDTGENLSDMNWVKGRLRAIVKKPSVYNRYTPDEQRAISDIARTGTLEKIGKLIPWRGLQMATTYAEPIAQDMKIGALQDLIARGGVNVTPPAPMLAPPSLSGYGGLLASQPRRANGQ